MKEINTHIIFNSIRGLYKALEFDWQKAAKTLGITPVDLHALWIIDHEEVTMSRIATLGLWDLSTVVGIIKRLKSKGLADVKKSNSDGRVRYVCLTEEGDRLREKSIDLHTYQIEKYFKDLWAKGGEEQKLIKDFLKLSDNINQHIHSREYTEWIDETSRKSFSIYNRIDG